MLGCSLAHLAAIRRAYLDKQDVALIVEDDISPYFMPYWTKGIGDIIKALEGKPWDSVQLSYVHNPQRPGFLSSLEEIVDDFLYKRPFEWGAAAYLISRKGMEKIMSKYYSDKTPTGHVVISEQFVGGVDNVYFPRTFTEHYETVPAMFGTLAQDTTFQGPPRLIKRRTDASIRSNEIQWMEWHQVWNHQHTSKLLNSSTVVTTTLTDHQPTSGPPVLPDPLPVKRLSKGVVALTYLSVPQSFTIGIKTLGRPHLVLRLCDSIRQAIGDQVRILVADDGKYEEHDQKSLDVIEKIQSQCQAEYIPMPYDSGLSAGRNEMVRRTMTRYYMSLDDDFVVIPGAFYPANLIAFLDAYPAIHLVGSRISSRAPVSRVMRYCEKGLCMVDGFHSKIPLTGPGISEKLSKGSSDVPPSCYLTDFVLNYFMARTEALITVPWDDELKLGEHAEYFLRFRAAGKNVAFCDGIDSIGHKQAIKQSGPDYNAKRNRCKGFLQKVLRNTACNILRIWPETISSVK